MGTTAREQAYPIAGALCDPLVERREEMKQQEDEFYHIE